jgi:glycerol-3-phosphate dehydrogenase
VTITGGKLMTYRLMAEWATDAVCRKLGNTTPCTTAESPPVTLSMVEQDDAAADAASAGIVVAGHQRADAGVGAIA